MSAYPSVPFERCFGEAEALDFREGVLYSSSTPTRPSYSLASYPQLATRK